MKQTTPFDWRVSQKECSSKDVLEFGLILLQRIETWSGGLIRVKTASIESFEVQFHGCSFIGQITMDQKTKELLYMGRMPRPAPFLSNIIELILRDLAPGLYLERNITLVA